MTQGLRNRSLLTIADLTADEIRLLLKLAAELKAAKLAGTEQRRLQGKNIALIFEKPSTRTRIGFEVAAYDQGAHVTYLGPSGTQMGEKETIKDTARVLGRIYDAIEYRGFSQTTVEELARHAGVPVFNGLTDAFHPTQVLGDFMTMREFTHKHLSGLVTAFIGDARNNVACSLAMGAMKVGMEMRLCGPKLLQPDREFIKQLEEIGTPTGGKVVITDDPGAAVRGADFIYTDVWLSMGESKELWSERIRLLKPYQVNMELLQASGSPHTKFMHCLPAFHDTNTAIAAQVARDFGIGAMEVTDDVFESAASIVFDQAENRMHTIKALLVATIGS